MSLNAVDSHILEILHSQRDALVKKTTDIVFASGSPQIDRASVEQLLRGTMAIIRRMYLETALPEVARAGTSPWRTVLNDGLPCWGIIVGLMAIHASDTYRIDVVTRLSRIMGTWWAEVWDVMSPVYKSKGEL